ncbi:hypothetical protein GFD17_02995 [Bifidobacterium sp. SMB2]|uniref:Uncharacterized protein n=1 Tax=Bifidobacterium saimiriisciurei TaxID=2661627 RepID=A0ABX0CAD0_9BIFI|nr:MULTISPECIES: hypothetical protein [Bifidobacterium]NEG95737.1 hypothetical protein [Bifidobacterium sp. SMB2]NEH11164.1 hypothetical protein [Bifidobacterium saimiriisciurei]
MQYVFVAVIAVACAVIGGVFAVLPRRTTDMDALQRKVSQALGVVFCLLFFVFMIAGRDLESWGIIGGGLVGFVVCSIPPVKRGLQERFVLFAPPVSPEKDEPAKGPSRKSPKKGSKRK